MVKATSSLAINDAEAAVFAEDGYVLKEGLFSIDEVTALNTAVKNDPLIRKSIYGRHDASGSTTELALWTELTEDMFSAAARSARIVDSLKLVLGGEIAFFHSKLTLKRPKVSSPLNSSIDFWFL